MPITRDDFEADIRAIVEANPAETWGEQPQEITRGRVWGDVPTAEREAYLQRAVDEAWLDYSWLRAGKLDE